MATIESCYAAIAQTRGFTPVWLLGFAIILFSLCVHESAHAITSYWGGDDTARGLGRITLNPISHIDLFGTILLPILGRFSVVPLIGWAKPVPVVPHNLKSSIWMIWVAGAGPFSNVMLALVAGFWMKVLTVVFGDILPDAVLAVPFYFIWINFGLAAFNMIPIPPLDGSKFLFHMVFHGRPHLYPIWEFLERFGFILIYAFMLIPYTSGFIINVVQFLVNLIFRLYGLGIS
jgi:Zn-dependent protease